MKAAIYLRTSTLEQHPEKQQEACLQFAKSRGYEVEGIYSEQLSGFKDIKRKQYDEIKDKAFKGIINAVIVWALDRWVRNRDTLIEDVTSLRQWGCKLHSVNDVWLESINIEGPLGKTIQEFLLGLLGSLAEMESQRKSERVKMAYNSHKGKKWGRKEVPSKTKELIIQLYEQGKNYREIREEVYYWDSAKHKKSVSLGLVHKTISESKRNKHRRGVVQ